ncbi:FG-GAP repeat domain-containing protein [Gloeobacter kilaueensis]|uniref:VCBS repeat-containing protein n=1 Tax=Gloeobacter kilaueensis (strain ATCC BAA-2537 / CCAP 1431/1 / ULC 316 / JS1) TaxID=1183438 RepID=U5QH98_GLOK1|nr:VCBS repeat-containing protein [Gloeobacter kilaueensis]AGY58296.1 hypothetical protein GKIL_2050 [Gloeobacter kilaueensis JS1]
MDIHYSMKHSWFSLSAVCLLTCGLFPGRAVGQTVPFTLLRSIPIPGQPSGLAAGDFNGDGRPDLVTANCNTDTVTLLPNLGRSAAFLGLRGVRSLPVGDCPTAVILADLDRDGDLDLITANLNGGSLSVLLNSGRGVFAAPIEVPVGQKPVAVAAGDLDADGDLDLVSANSSSSSITIVKNLGSGQFSGVERRLSRYINASSVAIGDLDGDKDLDLAVSDFGSSTGLLLLRNAGNGTFSTFAQLDPTYVRTVLLGDLDGDGDLDLVATGNGIYDYSATCILKNSGSGSFSETDRFGGFGYPTGTTLGDFDGDGDLDVVVGFTFDDGLKVFLNDGDGNFPADQGTFVPTASFPSSLVNGDFDGDGNLDVAAVLPNLNEVVIFRNSSP